MADKTKEELDQKLDEQLEKSIDEYIDEFFDSVDKNTKGSDEGSEEEDEEVTKGTGRGKEFDQISNESGRKERHDASGGRDIIKIKDSKKLKMADKHENSHAMDDPKFEEKMRKRYGMDYKKNKEYMEYMKTRHKKGYKKSEGEDESSEGDEQGTVEITAAEYKLLKKAKQEAKEQAEQEAEEKFKKSVQNAVEEELKDVKGKLDDIMKALGKPATTRKSVADANVVEKSFKETQGKEEDTLTKGEVLDKMEDLAKAGKISINSVIEYEGCSTISNINDRRVVEKEVIEA